MKLCIACESENVDFDAQVGEWVCDDCSHWQDEDVPGRMNFEQAKADFEEHYKPHLVAEYGPDDTVAFSEGWNNYTDSLCENGQITQHAYDTWGNPY